MGDPYQILTSIYTELFWTDNEYLTRSEHCLWTTIDGPRRLNSAEMCSFISGCSFKGTCKAIESTWTDECNTYACIEEGFIHYRLLETGLRNKCKTIYQFERKL